MKNSIIKSFPLLGVTVLLLTGVLTLALIGLGGIHTSGLRAVSAQAQEPSEDVPDVFNQGRFVEDEQTDTEVPAGEVDAWSGPWRGTIKIGSIKADGVEKTNAQVISEMEAHYLKKKKLREQAEAARTDTEVVPDIGGAMGDAIGEVLEETMDILFIALFDMAGQGVPLGFSTRKLDKGYMLYISETPEESKKDLDDVPLLQAEGANTLHAREEDTENNAVYDIKIVSNPNKTALDAVLSVKASGIKENDKSSLYDSVDIVLEGKFEKGEYSFEEFQEGLLVPMMVTVEKYNKKLNPEAEEQE